MIWIQNYSDGELNENSTMRKFGNSEFSTKPTNYYNLDVEKEQMERLEAKARAGKLMIDE